MKTGAVILAAGMPENLKASKAMLCVGGKPIIKRIVETLEALRLEPIVVVAGYRADIIERCLADNKVKIVKNRQFAVNSMLDSLKMGLKVLQGQCDRAFIFPGDMPMVSKSSLRKMLHTDGDILRPCYGERYGHPLLIRQALFASVLAYEGEGGLQGWLNEQQSECILLEDEGIVLDVNSFDDLEDMQEREKISRGKGGLHLQCDPKLVVEDVVMDTLTMQLMELMEYTGSLKLASELLRIPYTSSWRRIQTLEEQMGIVVIERAAGGARGGGSQLTQQGKELLDAYRDVKFELERMANWIFNDRFSNEFVENIKNLH